MIVEVPMGEKAIEAELKSCISAITETQAIREDGGSDSGTKKVLFYFRYIYIQRNEKESQVSPYSLVLFRSHL